MQIKKLVLTIHETSKRLAKLFQQRAKRPNWDKMRNDNVKELIYTFAIILQPFIFKKK
jgi:hypothetical protein